MHTKLIKAAPVAKAEKAAERTVSNKTRFKFDLRLDNPETLASIMQMVIDKIASLNKGLLIESCELKLFALPSFRREKVARLTVRCGGSQYISVMNSPRWDNAFLNAFDGICGKLRR